MTTNIICAVLVQQTYTSGNGLKSMLNLYRQILPGQDITKCTMFKHLVS